MPLPTKPPCNRVGLPIPLNLVHFLIPNLATEFDMKTPSHLFVGTILEDSQPTWLFGHPLQLDPHRKSVSSVEEVVSFIDVMLQMLQLRGPISLVPFENL